ncbi:MAG: peptidase domain-containing ABC transporter [Prevotella sp.]|nr:peptidase domain-containing ABC transporter [Prevotella sp.]
MRFPVYQQLDAMDCGSTCLRIVAKHYGRSYSATRMRELCHVTREGVSMLGVSDAAEKIGFHTAGVKITWEQLFNDAPLPCIVHWNQKHFVVVYKIKKDKVYLSDPASGLLEYSQKDFLRCWLSSGHHESQRCGTALLLEPAPEFYNIGYDEDRTVMGLSYLIRYLRPFKAYIVQLLLGMAVGSILSLILPFVTQAIVDTGIGTNNLDFIVVMLVSQLVIVLGQMANGLIRSWLMLHMTVRLSISLISDFLSKLMRLPISFFDSKMVGDILQRIGDYSRIQSFLTESLLSMVMAVVTFVVYGVVMAGYNLEVLGIFVFGSALYILWVLLFMKRRRKLDYMRFQVAATNQSNLVQLVTGMQDIKLNNCERKKRWEWERIQARLFNVSIKSLMLGQTQNVGGIFIDQIKNIMISFLTAKAVIDGDMTLGMMTAVQYIMGQLNAPVSQFITFVQSTQDAKISLERLNDIYGKEDEEPVAQPKIREIPDNADIEFRNVTFQYGGLHSEKVLDGISMTIPSNKVTAIVGNSGSGKTTLLKLILGFYHPSEGEVMLGGNRLGKYSDSVWRSKCGAVMQEGFIFSDTIINNIAVCDDVPNMERVRRAVETANIGDFIDGLPLGYHTKIGMEGHGLSTGQKQRLLIARAAYKDAKYMIFDEATNSLDANNERFIMEKLNVLFRNRTVVIVAHRLSTVRNADNIVVVYKGKITEQGTHEELINRRGDYYKLIKNQLELGN